ncbi:MAG: hypothetical protein JJE40_00195 [Vicinamibacteria bacterium]|nr:hypothetical protein [Vicinamibacteria bacterium]
MNAAKSPGLAAADAEEQLEACVAKFDPRDQQRIRAVRKMVRKRFPTANELVYDNYNFFVIGYSPTQRPSDAIVSIAARANGVGCASSRAPRCQIRTRSYQTRFRRG